EQVTIRGTGCMKDCKAGPNLVVMPGKCRYSRVTPQEIPELLAKHFSPTPSPNPSDRQPVPQS
ncbi:MAG: (2Fe-2S) ferredoxin domain-containing protein, partial [Kovacikia sp.]